MKINNINTVNCAQNTNFNGTVCKTVTQRAGRFCSPEKMEKYRASVKAYFSDCLTPEASNLCDKYKKLNAECTKTTAELKKCLEERFSDSIYLTIREEKEKENQSVLALFNSKNGQIMDVSASFDTNYGNINNILARFMKKAHNFATQIEEK